MKKRPFFRPCDCQLGRLTYYRASLSGWRAYQCQKWQSITGQIDAEKIVKKIFNFYKSLKYKDIQVSCYTEKPPGNRLVPALLRNIYEKSVGHGLCRDV